MAKSPQQLFDPCSRDENAQIPAKIWELLRRNDAFRADVHRLIELDAEERNNHAKTGTYHGSAWEQSCHLVESIEQRHPFAGVALQWLMPEPLFHCQIETRSRGTKSRVLRVGEGTAPNVEDKENWRWKKNSSLANHAGHLDKRGPELHWTTSKIKSLRDKVNPLKEWQRFRWPFTVEHSWQNAPPQFCRLFQFIWRNQFDSRPKNPISKSRSDSPSPHETDFFRGWRLGNFRTSGSANISHDDLVKIIKFDDLADHCRVFAIPRQLLTRQAAKGAFESLYKEVARTLLDARHFFGTPGQWRDFIAVEQVQSNHGATRKHAIHSHLRQNYGSQSTPFRQICQTYETDVTRRIAYIEKLRDLIFPNFLLTQLLQPMQHRRAEHPLNPPK